MCFPLRLTAAAIAVAFLALVAPTASVAADYSPSITATTRVSGDRVSASASADVDCTRWEATAVDFEGGTKTLPGGRSASVTFDAPGDDGTYHIRFVCTYDDSTVSVVPAASQTVATVAAFSVDGDDDSGDSGDSDESDDSDDSGDSDDNGSSNRSADASGGLPDTGGPGQELLWIALNLLGAGSVAIYVVRRRNANA